PAQRRRQNTPNGPHQIELESKSRIARQLRIDRPPRKRIRERVCRPGNSCSGKNLATTKRKPRMYVARKSRRSRSAQCEPAKVDGKNDREGIDGRAEHEAHSARPDYFRAERGHA